MKKALLLVLMLIIIASGLHAQDNNKCRYLQSGSRFLNASASLSFSDCTVFIQNQITRTEDGYGMWGDYAVHISGGEVYAGILSNNGQVNYQYWGTVPEKSQVTIYQPMTLNEIFDLAEEDINDFWTAFFEEHDIEYIKPGMVVFDTRGIRTGCGNTPAQVGPFYCPRDHTMYFPEAFMTYQHERMGDYAVVIIIAHEWGHAVQAQLGLLGAMSIKKELQADCLAGAYSAYAADVSTKVIIEDGDFEEALIALFSFGDSESTSWFDENAHGSGDQRMSAMRIGLTSGLDACE